MNTVSNTSINSFAKRGSEVSNASFITIGEFSKMICQSEKVSKTNGLYCRICLESSNSAEFISPCNCTGTIGILHKHCLERWLNISRSRTCEICGFKFEVSRCYPTFSEWIWFGGNGDGVHRRKHLWTDFICLLLMLPLLTLCAWLTVSSSQEEIGTNQRSFPWQSFSLGLLCSLLLVVFTIWLTFSVRYHHQSWKIWRVDNSYIVLSGNVNKNKIMSIKCDLESHSVTVRPNIQNENQPKHLVTCRYSETDTEHDQVSEDTNKLSNDTLKQNSFNNIENYCSPICSASLDIHDDLSYVLENDTNESCNKKNNVTLEGEQVDDCYNSEPVTNETQATPVFNSLCVTVTLPTTSENNSVNETMR
ncbi:unnamed protein product [Trichobilharzia szidati]|nr:unnamed protein product [Trichobilharzia szidati]